MTTEDSDNLDVKPVEPESADKPARFNILFILAVFLILTIISLIVAGWSYWTGTKDDMLVLQSRLESTKNSQQLLNQTLQETRKQLKIQAQMLEKQKQEIILHQKTVTQQATIAQEFDKTVETAHAELIKHQTELENTIKETQASLNKTPDHWVKSHAKRLLQLAKVRLYIHKDIEDTVVLLQEADVALQESSAFLPVRQQLVVEIKALQQFQEPDIDKLRNMLADLANSVYDLAVKPVVIPQRTEQVATETSSKPDDWQSLLLLKLKSAVNISRHDTKERPELTYRQESLLRQELRLAFDDASLALLRKDTQRYHRTLEQIRKMVSHYFEPGPEFNLQIDQISSVDVAPEVPPTGRALELLSEMDSQP